MNEFFVISDILAFPELLKNIENSDDYEDVSYDLTLIHKYPYQINY